MAGDAGPMQRAVVEDADRIIGERRPILNHGYVALVDYMGNDSAVVQAARVSYGKGTKTLRDDRGLIRYLMRHRHTTPFEMVEFKFLVRLPIYVARQWIRHRTACLAEGTRVYFDLPGGVRRRGNQLYPLRIEELWRRFQPTRNRAAGHQRNPYFRRDRVQAMRLRQLDESRWVFDHSRVRNVTQSGVKPVFRMTLEGGSSIECTADHRFLFGGGWRTLAEATGLRLVNDVAVYHPRRHELCVNGTEIARPALYHSRDWLEDAWVRQKRTLRDIAEACGVGAATISYWVRKHGLPARENPPSVFVPGNRLAERRSSRKGIPLIRRMSGTGCEPYTSYAWISDRWLGKGLSAAEIARECGASVSTVRSWLRKHQLTNHPKHARSRPFEPGHTPWNRNLRYRLGPRDMSSTQLAILREARSGAASNFWKGGITPERASIGRWTTQAAPRVHARHGWTCQLCLRRGLSLHAHHIVPVWADLSRARDETNLTSLCDDCHRQVHRDEAAYVTRLGGPRIETPWTKRPRVAWNKLTVPRWEAIQSFEYVGLRPTYDVEVEGPSHNFVANGIITHNSVNEYSARYSVLPDEFEVPSPEAIRVQSKRARQGGDEPVKGEVADRFRSELERVSKEAYGAYSRALADGVARETARLILPVAYYTQWYWKIDLWNLFHFLSLRLDPHAQEEIRLYAAEIAKIARLVAPVAFEAFEEFQLRSVGLSHREQLAFRGLLEGKTPEVACTLAGLPLTRDDGKPMTSGEGVEFLEKLDRLRRVD